MNQLIGEGIFTKKLLSVNFEYAWLGTNSETAIH